MNHDFRFRINSLFSFFHRLTVYIRVSVEKQATWKHFVSVVSGDKIEREWKDEHFSIYNWIFEIILNFRHQAQAHEHQMIRLNIHLFVSFVIFSPILAHIYKIHILKPNISDSSAALWKCSKDANIYSKHNKRLSIEKYDYCVKKCLPIKGR